jgi:hypothetical protein
MPGRYEDPKTFEGGVVRLCDLVSDEGRLSDYTFIDCQIKRPAILWLDSSVMTNNNLGGPVDALLWEVPVGRVVIGPVLVINCTFERCTFERVGFAGPPALIQNFRRGAR